MIHGHILAAEYLQADSPLRGKVWSGREGVVLGGRCGLGGKVWSEMEGVV